jgi:hypothetical protein
MDTFAVARDGEALVVTWEDDGRTRHDRFHLASPDAAFAVDEPDWRLEVLEVDDAGRPRLVRFDERLGGRTDTLYEDGAAGHG